MPSAILANNYYGGLNPGYNLYLCMYACRCEFGNPPNCQLELYIYNNYANIHTHTHTPKRTQMRAIKLIMMPQMYLCTLKNRNA